MTQESRYNMAQSCANFTKLHQIFCKRTLANSANLIICNQSLSIIIRISSKWSEFLLTSCFSWLWTWWSHQTGYTPHESCKHHDNLLHNCMEKWSKCHSKNNKSLPEHSGNVFQLASCDQQKLLPVLFILVSWPLTELKS